MAPPAARWGRRPAGVPPAAGGGLGGPGRGSVAGLLVGLPLQSAGPQPGQRAALLPLGLGRLGLLGGGSRRREVELPPPLRVPSSVPAAGGSVLKASSRAEMKSTEIRK